MYRIHLFPQRSLRRSRAAVAPQKVIEGFSRQLPQALPSASLPAALPLCRLFCAHQKFGAEQGPRRAPNRGKKAPNKRNEGRGAKTRNRTATRARLSNCAEESLKGGRGNTPIAGNVEGCSGELSPLGSKTVLTQALPRLSKIAFPLAALL